MTESAEEKSEDWLSQARTLRSQNLWHALLRLPVPHSAESDPEVCLLLAEALLKDQQDASRDAALRALSLLPSPLRTPALHPRALLLSGTQPDWPWINGMLLSLLFPKPGRCFLPRAQPETRRQRRSKKPRAAQFFRSSDILLPPCGGILGSGRGGRRPINPSGPDFRRSGVSCLGRIRRPAA